MTRFDDLFLAHPRAAGEGYFQHMRFAFGFAGCLAGASAAAFVHGLLPNLFETTASTAVLDLAEELKLRRAALAEGKRRAAAAEGHPALQGDAATSA